MPIIDSMIAELTHEAIATRKTLERVPEARLDWQPHPKSFPMGRLAWHLSEITDWVGAILSQAEFDLGREKYEPRSAQSAAELTEHFDASLAGALAAMKGVSDEHLMQEWTLRNGDQVFFRMPRVAVLRMMIMSHMIHHRAQLGLYLRLNDVPVPAAYGPSADEA